MRTVKVTVAPYSEEWEAAFQLESRNDKKGCLKFAFETAPFCWIHTIGNGGAKAPPYHVCDAQICFAV